MFIFERVLSVLLSVTPFLHVHGIAGPHTSTRQPQHSAIQLGQSYVHSPPFFRKAHRSSQKQVALSGTLGQVTGDAMENRDTGLGSGSGSEVRDIDIVGVL